MTFLRRSAASALGTCGRVLGDGADALADARRVSAFLAGRVAYRPRPDDVFVATYARSGTTLTQWIVYLLSQGGEAGEFRHINEVTPWFERGLSTGELNPPRIEALPSPRIFKTHLSAGWVPKGPRCIAVIRDGRDVAVSYYHFYRAYLRYEGSFEEFFDRFVSGRLQYGSWFDHVAGWQARGQDAEVLVVRYEELLADREGTVRRIAEHLAWPADDALVRRVAEASSFDAMKAREANFDHATALLLERGVTPKSFLRRGQGGEGEQSLGEGERAAFDRAVRDARPRRELWLPPFLQ